MFDGSPELLRSLCAEYALQPFDSGRPTELLAVCALQFEVVRMSTLAELIPLLPAEFPACAQDLDPRIHTFTAGASVRGGSYRQLWAFAVT